MHSKIVILKKWTWNPDFESNNHVSEIPKSISNVCIEKCECSSQNVCRGARNQRWKPRCQSWADLDVDDAVLLVGHVLSPHPPALRRVALMNFRIEKGYCERNVHYLARQASQYTLQVNFKKLKTALFSICSKFEPNVHSLRKEMPVDPQRWECTCSLIITK